MLRPEAPVPALDVPLVGGGRWNLHGRADERLTLLSFHRGHFCRFCRDFLINLAHHAAAFAQRRIGIVTLSMDGVGQASETAALLAEPAVTLGYGVTATDAERFGLFVTEVDRGGAVQRFTEPALLLLRPDNRLYAIIQSSVSCGRPDLPSLLDGIDILAAAGFPPRGDR